uniref:Bifunctional lysine-specific demethylase and histidyl-hydroxylase n=1 Tax=Aplanochytrium stocchinoi TaxID=215587 RepID=A0A7S3LN38_9STRA
MSDSARKNRNKRKRERKREKQIARYGGNKSLESSSKKLEKLIKAVSTSHESRENSTKEKKTNSSNCETCHQNIKKRKKNRNAGVEAIESIFRNVKTRDLSQVGVKALEWLISPTPVDTFLSDHLEKKVLFVQRDNNREYFEGILSKNEISEWLKDGKLSHNIDMTLSRYVDGKRETLYHDSSVKATPEKVWQDFKSPVNASLRILRPQQHADMLWKIVASLESYFGCCGGANSYLTPANSQGFAPHYDDIDAFILQLEGKKQWKVYKPYSGDDEELKALFPYLPRVSSRDFTEEEVSNLNLVLEIELNPGDMLYIPRGFVHQARSSPDIHSLHVTISTGQKNTWGDMLLRALPRAIETAVRDDQSECRMLRESLPKDYHKFMGVMHSDQDADTRRMEFSAHVVKLVQQLLLERLDVDLAADQMYAKFLHDRHKPRRVVENDSDDSEDLEDHAEDSDCEDKNRFHVELMNKLKLDSRFKLTVCDAARLTVEDDAAVVYHSLKNTRKYHEVDPRGLEFEVEDAEAIETILKSKPEEEPLIVRNLPHETDKDKLRVVQFLLTEKIITLVG